MVAELNSEALFKISKCACVRESVRARVYAWACVCPILICPKVTIFPVLIRTKLSDYEEVIMYF